MASTVMANPMGPCKAWFKMRKDGKQATIVGYYATKPYTLPMAPGGTSKRCYGMVTLLPKSTRSSEYKYSKRTNRQEKLA
jgi:hypothetical protein